MKNFILAVENVPKPMLIAEAVLIVLIIGVVAIRFFIIRSKPAYLKKLPRTVYDEETIHLLFNCYKAADSIEGMLHLAVKKSRNRKNKKRFKAAISYLYTSRYKDYETALYKYAGDGTEQTERLFTDNIGKEAAKKPLLPLKEESKVTRNNRKKYIIILIAFIVGLVANLAARAILPRLLPAGMQAWTGLLATLLEIVISVGIILIIIFTNHIGED